MVDGINFNPRVAQNNGNPQSTQKLPKDSVQKDSIFSNQPPTINNDTTATNNEFTLFGGTLPEVVVTAKKPEKDVATIDGGTLPEVVVTAKKPEKDVATINGGTLPEVVVTAQKPKKGFFAWLGRALGFSKA